MARRSRNALHESCHGGGEVGAGGDMNGLHLALQLQLTETDHQHRLWSSQQHEVNTRRTGGVFKRCNATFSTVRDRVSAPASIRSPYRA